MRVISPSPNFLIEVQLHDGFLVVLQSPLLLVIEELRQQGVEAVDLVGAASKERMNACSSGLSENSSLLCMYSLMKLSVSLRSLKFFSDSLCSSSLFSTPAEGKNIARLPVEFSGDFERYFTLITCY